MRKRMRPMGLDDGHDASILRVVCILSGTGAYGGPSDTAIRQARLAKELGFRAHVLAGTMIGDEPCSEFNVDTTVVGVRRWLPLGGFSSMFSVRMALKLVLCTRKADLVHVSVGRELVPLFACLSAIVFKRKLVVQPHGMLTTGRSSRSAAERIVFLLSDWTAKALVRRAHCIVALTEAEQRQLAVWLGHAGRPRFEIVGNPVEAVDTVATSSGLQEEAVFIARLHPRKRVDVFLSAADLAHREHLRGRYVVVGPDGGSGDAVREAAQRRRNVRYEGPMPGSAIAARLSRAGVFVLTSESEPWGNVLAQSIALGVPVILSRSAALSPLVESFGAGLVVSDGNAREVAMAVDRVLSDGELRANLVAGCGRLSASLLAPEIQATRWDSIYRQVLRR